MLFMNVPRGLQCEDGDVSPELRSGGGGGGVAVPGWRCGPA